MTLNTIAALLFEPRGTRYVGRHRAPDQTRVVAVASVPRPPITAVPTAD
jgi:hypothetical protein